MPVLPTFADLGSRDPVASRGVPTTPIDPTGAAWAGFGESLSKAGYGVAGAIQHKEEKADKFAAETAFIQFQDQQSQALEEAQRAAAPGAAGFSQAARENFSKSGNAFFSTLPEHLRGEYGPKLARLEAGVSSSARSFELKAGDEATVNLVNDSLGRVTNRLAGASDADTVTAVMREGRAQGETLIDAAPLSPIQKDAAKRSWRAQSSEAAMKRLIDVDPVAAQKMIGVAPADGGDTSAAGVLKRFEGYKSTPYWDVNALRTGYGSDTVTLADGTVQKVTKDTVVTKADADRDLTRRIGEFQSGIVRDVGADAWAKMSPNAQSALTSVAYNYGSLPKGVAAAVKTGDAEAIASSIEGLQQHNEGVNAGRRLKEAALVRGGGGDATGTVGDPLLADLPFAKRTALYADADSKIKANTAKATTEDLRVYNANLADLQTNIIDNKAGATEIQAARDSGWLKDPSAIVQLNGMVASRDKKVADITAFNKQIADPAFSWNSFDKKHIDAVDAGFVAGGGDLNTLQYVVDKTGIMPTSAGKALRGAFVSNDPNKVANAATVSANLLARNPNVFNSVDGSKDLEDNAVAFRQYTEHYGMTADEAAKKLIENQSPEYKAKVKARLKTEDVDTIIRKQGSDGTLQSDLRSSFDASWWPGSPQLESNPAARQAAMTDYGELLRDKYMETGDMTLAKSQAQAQLKKVWGVSKVSGNETIMRYPPDRAPAYAGIENVQDRIADQAVAAIKDLNGTVVDRKNIRLDPVSSTAERFNRGAPPTYLLSYTDKNGAVQTIPKQFYADPVAMRDAQTATRSQESAAIQFSAASSGDLNTARRLATTPDSRLSISDREKKAALASAEPSKVDQFGRQFYPPDGVTRASSEAYGGVIDKIVNNENTRAGPRRSKDGS